MKTNKGLQYLVSTDSDGELTITEVTRISDNVTFKKGDRVRTSNGTIDTIKGFTLYDRYPGSIITVSLNPEFDSKYSDGTGVNIVMVEHATKDYETGHTDGYQAGYDEGYQAAIAAMQRSLKTL